ncbi:protein terminal ear1 homolog [Vicia villosa]|uniref:protein terminal ear1 homolog n=1 Tax=Vicia villosa TaxID=3911 RepID=UPI00273BF5B5|nr:protein terminal ear1 homolog [Vicia villosa]
MTPNPYIIFLYLHQHHYFTKTLPIPYPITMQPLVSNLNPNAQPFFPQNTNNSHNHQQQHKLIPKRTTKTSRRRGNVTQFPNTIDEVQASRITTVMIRHIPNQLRFGDLLHLLDEHCYEINKSVDDPADWSKFDFLYLPMDYKKHAMERRMSNLGYAFVNFTTPSAAFKFYKQFQGFEWSVTENRKICEINAAHVQGRDKLERIFCQKVFRSNSHKFRPIVFYKGRDGFNRRMKGTPLGIHVRGLPFT